MRSYIDVNGNRLEVRWHGPRPAEVITLIFLHEGLGCADMWRDFPFELAAATGCNALVFSRLGYGRSDACELPRPLRFMHHEGLGVLPELVEKAEIEECILVGHSDGGSIGIIYAGGTKALPLRGVITEAAHVFCEDLSIQSIQAAREQYLKGDLRERLEKHHGSNTDCAFWGWNDAWLHPEFKKWNLEEYLPGIRVPFLAIQGEDDPYGTPAQVEAIVGKAGGTAQSLMLPDCGHAPHRDRPEATFKAMRDFILGLR